jgi:hypothetical protein
VPFFIRHFEKKGYDPEKIVNEAWERPDIGISNIFAGGLMGLLPAILLFGFHLLFFAYVMNGQIPSFEAFIYPIFVYCAISILISYIFLFRKDKYLTYFKGFNKKTHKWRIKWAWISFGVILLPFVVLILSFVAL